MINGMFDIEFRMEDLTRNGDPLVRLNECVDFEVFRLELETIREKERKRPTGRKPFDVVLMFKVLVLQSLYNLSDDAVEYQVRDRLSFMRFLGLTIGDRVPDAKTIWLFREELGRAGLVKRLFKRFDRYLREQGFTARKGQIVDASIVSAPIQRNSREENARIKEGVVPPAGRLMTGVSRSAGRRMSMRGGLRDPIGMPTGTRTTLVSMPNTSSSGTIR